MNVVCLSFYPFTGGDIFALEKLLIPINIRKSHYFTVCVFMKRRVIQVFDSLANTERNVYLGHIFQYLKDEYQNKHKRPLPKLSKWKLISSHGDNPYQGVDSQGRDTNDCGVYTCLFMDYLLLNLPLSDLTQERIASHGRKWLCKCILNKYIDF
jgi:Ulp1 family protease